MDDAQPQNDMTDDDDDDEQENDDDENIDDDNGDDDNGDDDNVDDDNVDDDNGGDDSIDGDNGGDENIDDDNADSSSTSSSSDTMIRVPVAPPNVSFETEVAESLHSDEFEYNEGFSVPNVPNQDEEATEVSSVADYQGLMQSLSTIGSSVVRGVGNLGVDEESSSGSSDGADYEGLMESVEVAKRKYEEMTGTQESASSKRVRSSEEEDKEDENFIVVANVFLYEKKDHKGKGKEKEQFFLYKVFFYYVFYKTILCSLNSSAKV